MASVVPLFLSFYLLLLLPCLVVAQTTGNVSLGIPIIASDNAEPWLSPSTDFAFGFRQLEKKDLFLLAIWYYQIPDRTIVWYANGDKPAPRGSKVELTAERGLVLSNPQDEVIWRSNWATGEVAYAVMNDTGNFVVFDRNSRPLWESFKYPTDTMLPTQIMEIDGLLTSRQKENNFSRGRFQFRLLQDGNAVLNSINLPSNYTYDAYYISGTYDPGNSSNSGYQVIFDEDGYLYVRRRNNVTFFLTPEDIVPSRDHYHRATLNFDGVFSISQHPKNFDGNQSWAVIRTFPDNICIRMNGAMGSGACGFNSICTLNNNKRPTCGCPTGYSILDPDDNYGSCKPDFQQGCEADGQISPEDIYNLEELPSTDWPQNDYELLKPCSLEDCRTSCLNDCLCVVAVLRGDGCWKKKLPLSNGRQDREVNGRAFLKVRKPEFTHQNPQPSFPSTKREQGTVITVVSVLLGGSVFVNLILVGLLCVGLYFFYHNKLTKFHRNENAIQSSLRHFAFMELEEVTNGFKEELGRGSFGIVYKGLIQNDPADPTAIAVKKLDGVVQDRDKEFKTEVSVIAQTHHRNLVKLLGYCHEGQNRMLVYEYLSNGTLASFLFGDLKPSWNQRTQIALGIARGLFYLHEECSPQIIHCDIKPQNILLDDYYDARISDFGLAKLLRIDQSHTNTAIRGTKGYVAPEWFKTVPVTTKVDVYSFGVLLLEIICCRRSVEMEIGLEKAILTDWACDCLREGNLDALVDYDVEALNDRKKLERFVMVAIWCIQEDLSLRPTIKKAMLMLEGIVQVSAPPCPCPFNSIS
ncbi:Receptor protein kinase 1 [Theobroma cacao]|uniref:Receptor-like serine/threonine-protein kinase n=1 Tax=Theobroma cacao TaxID=3641 RepID=A0A061GRK6_THECC|nr:Receptor protein kinase 1 [Theobroma cacao]